MILLGVTDPRTWPASSWLADIVPHVAYGLFELEGERHDLELIAACA